MKRTLEFLLICCLIFSLNGTALAATETHPEISVNGARIKSETPAYIAEGRTMVPLRLVANALNLEVAWEAATQTVTLTDTHKQTFKLTIGEKQAEKNGETVPLDAPAVIRDGKTFVPFRAIATGFGHQVEYDSEHKIVVINGNLQKPLFDSDGGVYEWGVIVRPGTGKFQSIAVGITNPALQRGIEMNLFPTYFNPPVYRECIRLKSDPQENFVVYAGSKEYNLGGQITEEVFIAPGANGFYEVAFFDMTGDGNNEILIYAGNPSGYAVKVFLFYSHDPTAAVTYSLPISNGAGYAVGDSGVAYMADGSLRLYFGNGGAYQTLKWNEETRQLDLLPLSY